MGTGRRTNDVTIRHRQISAQGFQLSQIRRQGQPVCGFRGHRRHGDRDQRRRRPGARASRPRHGRSERAGHSPPRRQPAIIGAEREPCEPGAGGSGLAQRRGFGRTFQEDEGNPGGRAAEARRDHRTRRRQDRGRQPHRDREEHRGHDQEPRLGRARAARGRGPAREAIRRAAQGADRFRRGLGAGDDGRPKPDQCDPGLGQSLHRRRHRGRAHRRAARQCRRQHQSDGLRHDGGAVGQQQRYPRRHREGIQGDAGARQIEPRATAEERRHQGAVGRGAEIAGARRGQDAGLQDPPAGTRRRRLRPDHSGGNPQAQCRPRHQRAAVGRRRAEGNRHLDLAGAPGDFAGDQDHARTRRRDPGRIDPVRLALCRRQHPAPDPQPAALDAASVRRRPRIGDLPVPPAATRSRRWRTRCMCSARA